MKQTIDSQHQTKERSVIGNGLYGVFGTTGEHVALGVQNGRQEVLIALNPQGKKRRGILSLVLPKAGLSLKQSYNQKKNNGGDKRPCSFVGDKGDFFKRHIEKPDRG
jgi:hypothetical protein